eukprot:XP_011439671.1 PREDICTED: kielin/chordin-like protein isoform X2 [Crassostrea gigas]
MIRSIAFVLVVLVIGNLGISIDDRSADCPFPCVINGHHFCRPPPCPVPSCRDPISIPGQCCGTCPEDCPKGTCKVGNKTTCYPVPCPLPPCVNPVTTPGDCCPHCPEDNTREEREQCPHPCLAGGQTYCHPVPCPFPPCDNPVTSPGDCCPHCPTGTV